MADQGPTPSENALAKGLAAARARADSPREVAILHAIAAAYQADEGIVSREDAKLLERQRDDALREAHALRQAGGRLADALRFVGEIAAPLGPKPPGPPDPPFIPGHCGKPDIDALLVEWDAINEEAGHA